MIVRFPFTLAHLKLAKLLYCTVGWVKLYKKFEIEKYAVCGKLILPKKWKGIKIFFVGTIGLRICMHLQIFASFLYPALLTLTHAAKGPKGKRALMF